MDFVLRMAARELRASWRRLLFFFVCVAIGVAAIVTLRSIIQSVRGGLMREARATIASDVLIHDQPALDAEVRADARAAARARAGSRPAASRSRRRRWCGPKHGAAVARMVELRGVEAGFPFYGTLALQGGTPYSHALLRNFGALVRAGAARRSSASASAIAS